jgi:hypothetical protein
MHHTQLTAEAVGLEYAGLIVVVTCDEIRIEVRCQLNAGFQVLPSRWNWRTP